MSAAPPTADKLDAFKAEREYLGAIQLRNERRARWVLAICGVMLIVQVSAGVAFRSLALIAAGLHMAAHVGALLVAAGAYAVARRYAHDRRFAFGVGKVGYLAAFANAVTLGVTALFIAGESLMLLFGEGHEGPAEAALPVAAAGVAVNLVSAVLLAPGKGHGHAPADLNLKAAWLHVWADVAVGLLAAAGIFGARWLGLPWLDAIAGLVGAVLVAHFAVSLLKDSAAVLLDLAPPGDAAEDIRARLEANGDKVIDLHLWRLGPGHQAAIVAIRTADPQPPATYRAKLAGIGQLSHVTIEVRVD